MPPQSKGLVMCIWFMVPMRVRMHVEAPHKPERRFPNRREMNSPPNTPI